MWTHLLPYFENDLTLKSIEMRGRVGLYRSLNIGRLITLVGSGISRPLDYPTWGEFASIYVEITVVIWHKVADEERHRSTRTAERARPQYVQLQRLCDPNSAASPDPNARPHLSLDRARDLGADIVSIIDLCEELLDRLGEDGEGTTRSLMARRNFAALFRAGGWPMMSWRLNALRTAVGTTPLDLPWKLPDRSGKDGGIDTDPKEKDDGRDVSNDQLCLLVRLLADARPLDVCLKALPREPAVGGLPAIPDLPAGTDAFVADLFDRLRNDRLADDPSRDVVGALLDRIGSTRWLTLNYDVEVERRLRRRHDIRNSPIFETLCRRTPTGRTDPKTVRVADGLQRKLESATFTKYNIGELIAFGAFTRTYDHRVFHLHGRIDDPPNMVITQDDYRRVYMRNGDALNAFEEAQEVVFGGNDLLFVGIGLTEEDVLRPFRRFVSRVISATDRPRNVFALMARTHGDSGPSKDTLAAIKRAENYGIMTIFYGGTRFKTLIEALEDLKKLTDSGSTKGEPVVVTPEKITKWKTKLVAIASSEALRTTVTIPAPAPAPDPGPAPAPVPAPAPSTDPAPAPVPGGPSSAAPSHVLLTQSEFDALHLFERPGIAEKGPLWKALVEEIENRVRSRALVHELADIRDQKGMWWDSWRNTPGERRAVAYPLPPVITGGHENVLFRHCPDEPARSEAKTAVDLDWRILSEAAAVWEKERILEPAEETPEPEGGAAAGRRRILRLAIPRGGGAGAFIRLLLRRENHERLFPHPHLSDGKTAYAGVYVVHLSYSQEFASVVGAFTRFVAGRVARLTLEAAANRGSTAVSAAERASIESARDRLRPIVREDTKIKGQSDLTDEELEGAVDRAYVRTREREPRLIVDPGILSDAELLPPVRRPHRLDVLQLALERYSTLTQGSTERLLLVLSGLDQLCDDEGDIQDAVHRAFFRILLGRTSAKEGPIHVPFDIVLVSGRPDVPINYLSLEGDERLPVGERQKYRLTRGTGRLLRRWSRLQPFHWLERLRLTALAAPFFACHLEALRAAGERGANEQGYLRLVLSLPLALPPMREGAPDPGCLVARHALIFLRWAMQIDDPILRDTRRVHPERGLLGLLWDNLGLSIWVLSAWMRHGEVAASEPMSTWPDLATAETALDGFVSRLDRAAARHGFDGVVDEILAFHHELDRRAAEIGTADAAKKPKPEDDFDPALGDLVMRHLMLFNLPVELDVLQTCPRVAAALADAVKKARGAKTKGGDETSTETKPDAVTTEKAKPDAPAAADEEAPDDPEDFFERRRVHAAEMDVLRRHLEVLERRALVVAIRPALPLEAGHYGTCEDWHMHRRWALHARLRRNMAAKMRLVVQDRGDQTHGQISLFCDQPKDLPTPSNRHLKLLREILKAQIDVARDTIRPAYRFSRRGQELQRRVWDEVDDASRLKKRREAAAQDVAQMLFVKDPEATPRHADDASAESPYGWNGGYGRIHALSHRLRGSYSLLRGTFSIGAISRIDLPDEADDESPYDIYNEWLRSLISLAVGIEHNAEEIKLAAKGRMARMVDLTRRADKEDAAFDAAVDDLTRFVSVTLRKTPRPAPAAAIAAPPASASAPRPEALRRRAALTEIRDAAEFLWTGKRPEETSFPDATPSAWVAQKSSFKGRRNPFYRDEIAWLYNERGLTALIQGKIYDAIPLFDQARRVIAHETTRSEHEFLPYFSTERRILLNLAVALIDRGNIEEGRDMLERLERSVVGVPKATQSHTTTFARAYLGLCDHLSGSLERARKAYEEALVLFNERRQLRAVSIFNRHLADMHRRSGRYDAAALHVELSVGAAQQAEQRDVLHMAELSRAVLSIARKKDEDARQKIDRAHTFAVKMNLYRLESMALLARTRLLMERGDTLRAGSAAAEAIAVSVRNGLGLQKLHALALYARIQAKRGDIVLSQHIHDETKMEAERLHYQIHSTRAEAFLGQPSGREED